MSNSKWVQQKYSVHNVHKYKGDINNIELKSSWEIDFAKFLDFNEKVLEWSSEEIKIPYFNPIKNHRTLYYPDFWVKYENKYGEIVQELIEVKPLSQIKKPGPKATKYQRCTWIVNQSKWDAAFKFCRRSGMNFKILSEKSIFK